MGTAMLSMRDHDVDDYVALHNMDGTNTVGVLSEDDWNCLDELGRYLASTDAWNRFAIWLLHKHFEPDAGEVFVERPVAFQAATVTSPVRRAAFSPGELTTIAVRFDNRPSSGVKMVGMEFTRLVNLGRVAPLNDADEVVLAGLADRLQALGKVDRFGARLIHDTLPVSDEQIVVETCDELRRSMNCRVVNRNAFADGPFVGTTWQWEPSTTGLGSVKACLYCWVFSGGAHYEKKHQ
jgi:hypothetical protein